MNKYIYIIYKKISCELFLIFINTHISIILNSVSVFDLIKDKIMIRVS